MGNLYRFTGCEFLLVCQICLDLQQRLYTTIFGHSKWNGHFPYFAYAKPGDSMRFRTLNSIFVNIFPLWIRFFNFFFFKFQSINSDLGGVVTECGQIRVWNLLEGSIHITATCHDLFPSTLTTKPIVSYFHVTEAGILYIMLSNGCAYSYSKNLECW